MYAVKGAFYTLLLYPACKLRWDLFLQVHATRQSFMSDLDRPAAGVRDMKRQCRGLGMAGEAYFKYLG